MPKQLFCTFFLALSPCAVSSNLDFYVVLSKCYPSLPFICPTLFTSLSALCVGSFPDDFNTKTDCFSEGCCLLKPFLPWLCYQALAWMICAGVFEQILTRVLSSGYSSPLGHSPNLIPRQISLCVLFERWCVFFLSLF